MRIQMVGQAVPSYYASIFDWCANAFEDIGHQVIRTDRNSIRIENETELVFYMDCSEDFSGNIPMTTRPQVFWSLDQHMPGGIERSVNIARKCDLTFCTNKEHGVDLLEKFGIDSVLMPVTWSNRLCKPSPIKNLDVTMIGHPNSQERIELWNLLNRNWTCFTGPAKYKESYMETMGGAKIVVNQPTEPWNIILNNRFFEGMACKALLLQKRIKTTLIEDLGFIEGEDFVYWDDFGDLSEKIAYYLSRKEEREKIVQNGFDKIQQYSFNNQCQKVIDISLDKLKSKFNV